MLPEVTSRVIVKHMLWVGFLLLILLSAPPTCLAAETPGPEEALRTLVRANAEMDFATMANLMAHDVDAVEFETVARLEIPITELKVWTRGDTA